MKQQFICTQCGKTYEKYACLMKPGSKPFCSQRCLFEYRRNGSKITCHKCGKEVYRRYGEQDIGKRTHQFCSRECYMTERRNNMKVNVYPKSGAIHIHRIVAGKVIGRQLKQGEIVHHVNGDKHDCSESNLMVFKSQKDHMEYHFRQSSSGKVHK